MHYILHRHITNRNILDKYCLTLFKWDTSLLEIVIPDSFYFSSVLRE